MEIIIKLSYLYLTVISVRGKQNVFRLQITVCDASIVQILYTGIVDVALLHTSNMYNMTNVCMRQTTVNNIHSLTFTP